MGHCLSRPSGEVSGVAEMDRATSGNGTSHGAAEPARALRPPIASAGKTAHTALLLLPNFSLMSVIAAIDVMRHANRLSRKELYQWYTYSADGGAVRASNGLVLTAEMIPENGPALDNVFVCGGFNPERFKDPAVFRWLRNGARRGVRLGATTTGAYVLARAGLMDR